MVIQSAQILSNGLLKKNYRWKRFRRSLRQKRNERVSVEEYNRKVLELDVLISLDKDNYIALYYGDESGFSGIPSVVYGWQKAGITQEIPAHNRQQLNVFGLYSATTNDLRTWTSEKSMKSVDVIQAIDEFITTINKRTIIVLDNASIHKSKAFKDKVKEWEQQDLWIFYLPPYCPHLNKIETLWRKIKYEWLEPENYKSWKTLSESVKIILSEVGKKRTIVFT